MERKEQTDGRTNTDKGPMGLFSSQRLPNWPYIILWPGHCQTNHESKRDTNQQGEVKKQTNKQTRAVEKINKQSNEKVSRSCYI